MSILESIYRDVARIDRVKPVNLRFVINTKGPLHPFVDQGRFKAFARRNGKRVVYLVNNSNRPVFILKNSL